MVIFIRNLVQIYAYLKTFAFQRPIQFWFATFNDHMNELCNAFGRLNVSSDSDFDMDESELENLDYEESSEDSQFAL